MEIVIYKLPKRHSKPRAGHQLIHVPCYESEGLPKENLGYGYRTYFQRVSGDMAVAKEGVILGDSGKREDRMSQSMNSWKDGISILSGKPEGF